MSSIVKLLLLLIILSLTVLFHYVVRKQGASRGDHLVRPSDPADTPEDHHPLPPRPNAHPDQIINSLETLKTLVNATPDFPDGSPVYITLQQVLTGRYLAAVPAYMEATQEQAPLWTKVWKLTWNNDRNSWSMQNAFKTIFCWTDKGLLWDRRSLHEEGLGGGAVCNWQFAFNPLEKPESANTTWVLPDDGKPKPQHYLTGGQDGFLIVGNKKGKKKPSVNAQFILRTAPSPCYFADKEGLLLEPEADSSDCRVKLYFEWWNERNRNKDEGNATQNVLKQVSAQDTRVGLGVFPRKVTYTSGSVEFVGRNLWVFKHLPLVYPVIFPMDNGTISLSQNFSLPIHTNVQLHTKFQLPSYGGIVQLVKNVTDAEYIMYSNADIFYTASLPATVLAARAQLKVIDQQRGVDPAACGELYLTGRRFNFDVPKDFEFNERTWQQQVTNFSLHAQLFTSYGMDYFLAHWDTWGQFVLPNLPQLLVGGVGFDTWMTSFMVKHKHHSTVDGTFTVPAVHQNHGSSKASHGRLALNAHNKRHLFTARQYAQGRSFHTAFFSVCVGGVLPNLDAATDAKGVEMLASHIFLLNRKPRHLW
eukprot:TRINITY_DN52743_c0_g1_i1.p1 TRINITY_DN52743_c0_g1~~TRINITY_DN52743_c0_g1_i1.p1  ORF type:complete len:588 (-),score=21.85 TRINITY_DN52743_c0_g1_i1:43-1806(-)